MMHVSTVTRYTLIAIISMIAAGTLFFMYSANQAGAVMVVDDPDTGEPYPFGQCQNGVDDDGNGYADYPNDVGCTNYNDPYEGSGGTQCSDGIDNDGDGDVDYLADAGCASAADNSEGSEGGSPTGNSTTPEDIPFNSFDHGTEKGVLSSYEYVASGQVCRVECTYPGNIPSCDGQLPALAACSDEPIEFCRTVCESGTSNSYFGYTYLEVAALHRATVNVAEGVVPLGTTINVGLPRTNADTFWFVTGNTMDSPPGCWLDSISGQWNCTNTSVDTSGNSNSITRYFGVVFDPPTVTVSSTNNSVISCNNAQRRCTTAGPGTAKVRVTFASLEATPYLRGKRVNGENIATQYDPYMLPQKYVEFTYTVNAVVENSTLTGKEWVNGNPPANQSGADDTLTVTRGQSARLYWSSDTSAGSCSRSMSPSNAFWSGSSAVNGQEDKVVNLNAGNYQLFLDCGTADRKTVYLTVNNPVVVPSVNLTADDTALPAGESTQLKWSSQNVASCGGTNFSTGSATQNTTGVTVSPSVTTTYTITCNGVSGSSPSSASDSVTVTVSPAAVPNLVAANTAPTSGATFTTTQGITFTGTARNNSSAVIAQGGWHGLEVDLYSDGIDNDTSNSEPGIGGATNFDYYYDRPQLGAFTAGQTKNLSWSPAAGTFPVGTHRYRWNIDSTGGVTESNESDNRSGWTTFTVNTPASTDLASYQDPTLQSGTLTQGQNVTFRGYAQNTGTTNIGAFSDNFSYRWGTSGAWTQIGGHIAKASLSAAATSNDTSTSFNLANAGTLQLQHCVDSQSQITESDEGNNCRITAFTVAAPTQRDLSAGPSNPTLRSGTLEEGNNVTFSGYGRNTGTESVSGFSNNFTYRWGTSGAWMQIGSHIPFIWTSAPGSGWSADPSSSFNLNNSGTLQIQYCVDSQGQIAESNESNNCSVTSFTVTAAAPTYSCTGVVPTNASFCSGDGTAITANTPRTAVNACSTPVGSDPKCEYLCNAGYTAVDNRCMLGTISVSPTQVASGGTSVISWNVTGAGFGDTCVVSGGSDTWQRPVGWTTPSSGSQTSAPVSTPTTYTLSCHGVALAWATVYLLDPPTLTANPRIVEIGQASSLEYDLNGNPSCTLTGGGLNQVLATQTGTISTGAVFGTTEYTLSCGTVSTSVMVEVREEGHET